eukprot:Pgem_evm1s10116
MYTYAKQARKALPLAFPQNPDITPDVTTLHESFKHISVNLNIVTTHLQSLFRA